MGVKATQMLFTNTENTVCTQPWIEKKKPKQLKTLIATKQHLQKKIQKITVFLLRVK